MLVDAVRLLVFPTLMAFAASSDLLTMTISNKISIALIVGFVVLAVAAGMSADDMLVHLGAGLLVLAMTLICYWRGWIGGGDAKLASATALWLGFDQLYNYLLVASLLGGVLTLAIMRFRQLPLSDKLARYQWIARLHQIDMGVPYGIALAIAALIVYPSTVWMKTSGF